MKIGILLLLALCATALADDFTVLCADRTAVERVYYNHRLGDKPPFEQAVSHDLIEKLVREDLHKEAVLKRAYAIEITAAQVEFEVRRIKSTTRAPDVLAELKAALGGDSIRFARTVARPIVVERLLRDKFDNDDSLHAPQRREAVQARNQLLAAKTNGANSVKLLELLKGDHAGTTTETTWLLSAPPAETNVPPDVELEIKKRFGPNAQMISSPPAAAGADRKHYFQDLPPELQNVLHIQLRQAGDVSAVIETPGGFLLYVAKEKTDTVLGVGTLSIPKRGYDQWLAEQPEAAK